MWNNESGDRTDRVREGEVGPGIEREMLVQIWRDKGWWRGASNQNIAYKWRKLSIMRLIKNNAAKSQTSQP